MLTDGYIDIISFGHTSLAAAWLEVWDAYCDAVRYQDHTSWSRYYQTTEAYWPVHDDRVRMGHGALTLNGEA